MTSRITVPVMPQQPGAVPGPHSAPRGPGGGFASLLDAGGGGAKGGRLADALAEMFNAHGFFIPATDSGPDPRAATPAGSGPGVVAHAAESQAVTAPGEGAEPHPTIGSDSGIIAMDRSDTDAATLRLHPEGSDVPGPRDGRMTHGADCAGQSPTPAMPRAPGSANPFRAMREATRPGFSQEPARAPGHAACEDRFVFQVGAETVVLTGRLNRLNEDEQRLLLGRLSGLLATHGLCLGDVTLNGLPAPSFLSGTQR